ncbi:MAG: hypothetical protein LC708_00980, partial [Actinobacteria bacterium]|nr:hypothetical protein [Actinomycetota bacterium]
IYRWVASYSGDASNAPAGPTACADPLAATAVLRVTPTLATVASAGAVGAPVFDTATLSGGVNPTGTITFQLFDNGTCTGPPRFANTKAVAGNSNVVSDSFVLPAAGTYHFVVTYSGDANNNPVGPTACLDPLETVVAGRLPVSLTTVASPSVPAGGVIFATATVGGGLNPTGSMTFRLFGPDDTTCSGTPASTSTVPVNGSGSYPSASFTATTPGTYRWVAAYSGDPNNAPAVTACGDPLAQVVATPRPVIVVDKTATPESRPAPGGTFTFNVVVTNASAVPLTITSLTDDVYGDVTTRPGSTCNTAIGTVLASSPGPGNTYACGFQVDFGGPSGASQADTVTAVARDAEGNNATDSDDAIVRMSATYACSFTGNFFGDAGARQTDTIVTTAVDGRGQTVTSLARTTVTITDVAPSIRVAVNAAAVAEPGGESTVTVTVTNTSFEPVTLVALTDNVYGSLDRRGTCAVGVRLAPANGTYTCSFPINLIGDAGSSQTDTVTATVVDDDGTSASAAGSATVRVTDVPPMVRVDMQPVNPTLPAPGGEFVYRVVVTNTSSEPVTVVSLAAQPAAPGNCVSGVAIAPNGGTYTCFFVRTFTGGPGASQTDRVTVVVVDNDGSRAVATDDATVTITAAPPDDGGTTTSTSTTPTTRPPTVTVPQVTSTSVIPVTTTTTATTTTAPTTTATTTTAPT